MRVNFTELDYWMVRGFSGILDIVQQRLTRVPMGFCARVRQLMAGYLTRMSELNDGVQCREQEVFPDTEADLKLIDEWFVYGFRAIDRHLDTRSRECQTPMSEASLCSIEEHAKTLMGIVERERAKCQSSSGETTGS